MPEPKPEAKTKSVKQPELPLEAPEFEEMPEDERQIMKDALELTGGGGGETFKRRRQELVKMYADNEQTVDLKLIEQVGVLDILKGHKKAFQLIQAVRRHPDADALIPAILYSIETPQLFRLARPGPGGQILTYVPGDYVIMMLNAWFPGWSFKTQGYETILANNKAVEIICQGELILTLPSGNQQIIAATGRNPIHYKKDTNEPVSIGNARKGAEIDSIKKCASRIGIAWDVYYGLYSPAALEVKAAAQRLQAETEGRKPHRTSSKDRAPGQAGKEKMIAEFAKSFKLSEKEPLKSFWGKARELYAKDKTAGKIDDGAINNEIHAVATDYLEVLGKFKGEGLVSIKDLSADNLQDAIIGIALHKLYPKYFPKKQTTGG